MAEPLRLMPYILLIRAFVEERLRAEEFEMIYPFMVAGDATFRPDDVYCVLNDLFIDVDAYCSDPSIRAADELDEGQLRQAAESALRELERRHEIEVRSQSES